MSVIEVRTEQPNLISDPDKFTWRRIRVWVYFDIIS
jgi:hypothetical protein